MAWRRPRRQRRRASGVAQAKEAEEESPRGVAQGGKGKGTAAAGAAHLPLGLRTHWRSRLSVRHPHRRHGARGTRSHALLRGGEAKQTRP